MKINEPDPKPTQAPLWRLAFRAGFLAAGAFAVLGMLRWLAWMLWPTAWDYTLYPNWWHAHEMVFGFAMPVVAGFLLTAVATWTGQPGTTGTRLKLLFGFWFLARLVLWLFPGALLLAWLAETLFFTLLIFELTRRVWAVRQWRNLLFTPVLLILVLLNWASYWWVDDALQSSRLHYGAIWMITVLVVIIGGRVIPLFTGNRLGITIAALPAWLDYLAIGSTVLIGLLATLTPMTQASPARTLLLVAASGLHLARLLRWQGYKTIGVPLLWSMHLSYLCIPLAMLALAFGGENSATIKNVIHLLAIGTIGGMILAMMSRVALGHTGRPLDVPRYLSFAFGGVFLAAILRAFLPEVSTALSAWAWRLPAAIWIVAFALFLLRYTPILTSARADGKPG